MSDQPGNNGDHEPQRKKRQKCGNGDGKKVKIIAFGGPMYDEATARKMLKEVVLVSAEKAEDGEPVIIQGGSVALDSRKILRHKNDELIGQGRKKSDTCGC